MRVFRDDANLDANPDLWGNIAAAIEASSTVVLLASPASAASSWVQREIDHFQEKADAGALLVIVIDGAHPWVDDEPESAKRPAAVSPIVRETLSAEYEQPMVLDMRRYRTKSGRFDRNAEDALENVATIAAAILNRNKDELIGEHLTAKRLRTYVVALASAFVLTFAALAAYQTWDKSVQMAIAEDSRAKMLEEIKDLQCELQEMTDRDGQLHQLVGGIKGATTMAIQTPPISLETRKLAVTLRKLVDDFESRYRKTGLSEVESLEVRLAKATLANSEQRFSDAYHLLRQPMRIGSVPRRNRRLTAK